MTIDSGLMGEWLKLAGYAVFDGFDDAADVAAKFKATPSQVEGIIAAIYGQESYEGSAFVLLVRDGKLYEVYGSHCSCHGLEDQWGEEETTVKALRKRSWPSGCEPGTKARMEQLLDMLSAMEKKQ